MVNRYTTTVLILEREAQAYSDSEDDIKELAIAKARLKRPLITRENVTDLVIDRMGGDYAITVNWWPHKRDDQI